MHEYNYKFFSITLIQHLKLLFYHETSRKNARRLRWTHVALTVYTEVCRSQSISIHKIFHSIYIYIEEHLVFVDIVFYMYIICVYTHVHVLRYTQRDICTHEYISRNIRCKFRVTYTHRRNFCSSPLVWLFIHT